MKLDFDFKLLAIVVPLAGIAWKWLRGHNDRTITPPSHRGSNPNIEQLVHDGQTIAAIKAIRKMYGLDLRQAKARFDQIKARQSQKS